MATLLTSMAHEHQRASGAWHAEWLTLAELLRATGGAAARLRTCRTGLDVHADVMAARVPEPVPHPAGEIVDALLHERNSR